MTLSGDQNGGLARMLAGVHGWAARGCPKLGVGHNSKVPSSIPVHKSEGVAWTWGLGLEGGLGFPTRHQTHCSNHC